MVAVLLEGPDGQDRHRGSLYRACHVWPGQLLEELPRRLVHAASRFRHRLPGGPECNWVGAERAPTQSVYEETEIYSTGISLNALSIAMPCRARYQRKAKNQTMAITSAPTVISIEIGLPVLKALR